MSVSALVLRGERLAELLGEQPAHVGRRQVHGGRDDVHGPLAGQLHEVFAQVGLDRADACSASSMWFSSISSLTIDFDLTTVLTLCSRAMRSTCWLASSASLAQSTVAPRAEMFRSNSTSSLSRLAMAYCFDAMGRLAPILEIGDRVGDDPIRFAGAFGVDAQRFRGRRLAQSLGLVGEEFGAVEMEWFSGHNNRTLEPLAVLHCSYTRNVNISTTSFSVKSCRSPSGIRRFANREATSSAVSWGMS